MYYVTSRKILELHKSDGLHDLGTIKWDMALCLIIVYLICYFSLWKGISTSGKVKIQYNTNSPTLFTMYLSSSLKISLLLTCFLKYIKIYEY